MKSTGRHSAHEESEMKPEKPFLKDLQKDLESINKHYVPKTAKEIKKKMIELILKDI